MNKQSQIEYINKIISLLESTPFEEKIPQLENIRGDIIQTEQMFVKINLSDFFFKNKDAFNYRILSALKDEEINEQELLKVIFSLGLVSLLGFALTSNKTISIISDLIKEIKRKEE